MSEYTVTFEDADFTINTTPSRKLVDVTVRGYWEKATFVRFATALKSEVATTLVRGGCTVGDHVTLIDATDFPVQSQEISTSLSQLAIRSEAPARRIAVIMNSALLRMQAQRVAPNFGTFERRGDAMDWLFSLPSAD